MAKAQKQLEEKKLARDQQTKALSELTGSAIRVSKRQLLAKLKFTREKLNREWAKKERLKQAKELNQGERFSWKLAHAYAKLGITRDGPIR